MFSILPNCETFFLISPTKESWFWLLESYQCISRTEKCSTRWFQFNRCGCDNITFRSYVATLRQPEAKQWLNKESKHSNEYLFLKLHAFGRPKQYTCDRIVKTSVILQTSREWRFLYWVEDTRFRWYWNNGRNAYYCYSSILQSECFFIRDFSGHLVELHSSLASWRGRGGKYWSDQHDLLTQGFILSYFKYVTSGTRDNLFTFE